MVWPYHTESSELAHTDSNSDVESVSDMYDRKHVNRFENADDVYLLQNDTETVHTFFKIPGVNSANALRQFLADHLPEESITDEYGCVDRIAEISADHLPKLQAQLWLNETERFEDSLSYTSKGGPRPQGRAPLVQRRSNTTESSPRKTAATDELLRIACHVTFIAELFQVNHIFIHSKKAISVCELSFCPSRSKDGSYPSSLITIEPLIHWGTVTPATDIPACHARIQVFRRDGEKCEDPLWTQAIDKLIPQHPTSYCLGCLGLMMEKSTDALRAMQNQKPASFKAVNSASAFRPQGRLAKSHDSLEVQFNEIKSPYNSGISTVEGGYDDGNPYDHAPLTSLNLDGSPDLRRKSKAIPLRPGRNKYGFPILTDLPHEGDVPSIFDSSDHDSAEMQWSRHKDSFSILIDPRDSDERTPTLGGHDSNDSSVIWSSLDRGHSVPTEGSFTSAPTTMNVGSTMSVWAIVNRSCSDLSAPPTSRNHHCPEPQPSSTGESQSRPSTSAQITNRRFGRELDANIPSNAVTEPVKQTFTMETNKTAQTDVRDFFAKVLKDPTGQMSRSPRSVDTSSSPEPKSSDSCETTASSASPPHHDHDDVDADDEALPQTSTSPKSLSPKSSPPPPKPTHALPLRKVSPTSKSPQGPFFAKFSSLSSPDESIVSAQALKAHLTRVPSSTETICTCRLPASSASLAQCSNPECVFVWLHYDCLDKAGKISARHGRLVCQHCRNARDFGEKDDVVTMVAKEMEFNFSGADILAAMPGVGGLMGVVDPYGLGSMMRAMEKKEEVVKQDDGGALGALGLMGYAESRPGVVGEAYLEPTKYAERVRKMVEAEEQGDEEYWDEEGYEYEDEEYGYEEEKGEEEHEADTGGRKEDEDGDEDDVSDEGAGEEMEVDG